MLENSMPRARVKKQEREGAEVLDEFVSLLDIG